MRLRGPTAERQQRPSSPVPLVASAHRTSPWKRCRPQSPRHRRLPSGQLPRVVRHPRQSHLRRRKPRRTPTDVVQGALPGSPEDSRPASRSRRQVPTPAQTPSAQDHLGRRGDGLLLQGEGTTGATGLLPAEPLPDAGREASARQEDRTDSHASEQLVQEQKTARQNAAATAAAMSQVRMIIRSNNCAKILCFATFYFRFLVVFIIHTVFTTLYCLSFLLTSKPNKTAARSIIKVLRAIKERIFVDQSTHGNVNDKPTFDCRQDRR